MMIKNAKFLLIDDDPFVRQELIRSLQFLDFEGPFLEATDGKHAIQIIKSNYSSFIDFIICDINMPNMDGISFLFQIKKDSLIEVPIPIMMLTSENDLKIVTECIKLGASSYLLKPWTQTEIAKKLVFAWEKVHNLNK